METNKHYSDFYLEPHIEYYWDDEQNREFILYFGEKYEFNSVLNRIKEIKFACSSNFK